MSAYAIPGMPRDNPFRAWLRAHYDLEVKSFGNDPPTLRGEERKDFFRWNAFALEDELHEAGREIAWKPWATSDHFNREAYLRELADVMFFLANEILIAANEVEGVFMKRDGGTVGRFVDVDGLAAEFWQYYQEKVAVNAERMEQGYDGVTDKCPRCGRELKGGPCPEHGWQD